ncbi:MAG: hypothetical protein GY775_20350 [Candidatus Scalindua sp.]|nr:hypothetical protein [Candidatus Scalindua sp.]
MIWRIMNPKCTKREEVDHKNGRSDLRKYCHNLKGMKWAGVPLPIFSLCVLFMGCITATTYIPSSLEGEDKSRMALFFIPNSYIYEYDMIWVDGALVYDRRRFKGELVTRIYVPPGTHSIKTRRQLYVSSYAPPSVSSVTYGDTTYTTTSPAQYGIPNDCPIHVADYSIEAQTGIKYNLFKEEKRVAREGGYDRNTREWRLLKHTKMVEHPDTPNHNHLPGTSEHSHPE